MTDTNAMREVALQNIATAFDCEAEKDTVARAILVSGPWRTLDAILALLATDRAAGVGEAFDPAQIAFDQQCDDPEPGGWNDACLHIAKELRELRASMLDLAASPPAPADASGEVEKRQFAAGYMIACANIVNLHGEDTIAEDVLAELGETEAMLRKLELSDYDAKPLRRLFREISRKRGIARRRIRAAGSAS